jgi:hypothetical protein
MGCNCGGNKNAKVRYVYTDPKGRQTSYNSEYEAKAAKIRNAGEGSIRTVQK